MREDQTYVELVLGNVVEGAGVGLEVLGQHADGRAQEHLRHEEGLVLAEVTLVEDKQELSALVKGLDRVRHAGGEEPHVAGAHIVHKGGARGLDARHAHAALEHERPLVGRVPVQLAVGVGREAHVDAGHGLGAGQHVRVLLAGPAGALLGAVAVVRQAHGPHGLRHGAAVGARHGVHVWVQPLVVVGARARVRGAVAAADGLRHLDAVEVQVQAQLVVCVLADDVLRVLDHGGVRRQVGLCCAAAEEVLAAVERACGCRDGGRGRVDSAYWARVLAIISHSEVRVVSVTCFVRERESSWIRW